jgi:hypothetical protein
MIVALKSLSAMRRYLVGRFGLRGDHPYPLESVVPTASRCSCGLG